MTDLLKQALVLTVWGMGMTFLALGALVIGMYLMTALSKDRTEPHPESDTTMDASMEEDNIQSDFEHLIIENQVIEQNGADLNLAVAATVAVALALSLESEEKQYNTPAPIAAPAAWDHYVRGRHLSQRSHFEQLKRRK